MGRMIIIGALLLMGAVACTGSEATDTGIAADADRSSSSVSVISASTIDTGDSAPDDGGDRSTTVTSDSADGDDSQEDVETTTAAAVAATTTSTAAATTAATTAATGTRFTEEAFAAFTSPSGNIACLMTVEYGASCYISEKTWTIDQPTEPDCEVFDFGNAVDVTTSGVVFPCYSDFSWDPAASALEYGDGMQVGEFICTSGRDGMSCVNSLDQGFRVARAELAVL